MFTPQTYSIALLLMTLSMLCWGSWANTQKITRNWPFELYYFDYSLGLLACSLFIGLTLGQINPSSPQSFFLNLRAASPRSLFLAFAGGAVFSVGNILIVAAISVAGMAVAFPIGAGLALVLGAGLNYVVSPAGNPVLIFSGIGLVCIAIVLDALAYRGISRGGAASGIERRARLEPCRKCVSAPHGFSRRGTVFEALERSHLFPKQGLPPIVERRTS